MLAVLSGFDLASARPARRRPLHLELEAGRLAYQILQFHRRSTTSTYRSRRSCPSPTDKLRARSIRACCHPAAGAMSPSRHRVTQRRRADRNTVSFINSTFHSFGSAVMAPRSGIVLENRGSLLPAPSGTSQLHRAKRPMHTIMPGMATRDGRVLASFGVMDGDFQPFGHVHLLTNILDHGLISGRHRSPSLPSTMAPSWPSAAFPQRRSAACSSAAIASRRPTKRWEAGRSSCSTGSAGTLTGGSDPRKDGLALGL